MLKINLYDNVFKHNGSTVVGQLPQNFEYVYDGSGDINLFSHEQIAFHPEGLVGRSNFGIVFESYGVMPGLYHHLKDNTHIYKKYYKTIFTYHKMLLDYDNLYQYCPAYCLPKEVKDSDNKKHILISSIASGKNMTYGHNVRNKLSQIMASKNYPVFGKIINKPLKVQINVIEQSYFNLAVENNDEDNYFTEKILNCFANKTIPIYFGCPNLKDFNFDLNGVINLNEIIKKHDSLEKVFQEIESICTLTKYNELKDSIEYNKEKTKSYDCCIEDWIFKKGFFI